MLASLDGHKDPPCSRAPWAPASLTVPGPGSLVLLQCAALQPGSLGPLQLFHSYNVQHPLPVLPSCYQCRLSPHPCLALRQVNCFSLSFLSLSLFFSLSSFLTLCFALLFTLEDGPNYGSERGSLSFSLTAAKSDLIFICSNFIF